MIDKFIFRSLILLLVLTNIYGCAALRNNAAVEKIPVAEHNVIKPGDSDRTGDKPLLAVLPIQNYSSRPASLKNLRRAFIQRLQNHGLKVLNDEQMEAFMSRHRLRHVGDIGLGFTQAFAEEAGVDGIIITYLEEYRKRQKIFSLMARLTMTTGLPMVVWMDDVSFAGNEAPGLLGLGRVHNIKILEERGLERLAGSLSDHLEGKPHREQKRQSLMTKMMDFQPRIHYKSPAFQTETKLKIAIMPFRNESQRRFAGELIGLHLMEHFVMRQEEYAVIEPGVVRDVLLDNRVILPYGLSVVDEELVFSQLPDVDLVLSGKVLDYNNPGGANMPDIWFNVYGFASKNYEIVWSSQSINRGDEGLHLFGLGRVFTAAELSSLMTEEIVRILTLPEEL